MPKRIIRVDLCDFWRVNKNDNFFVNLLRERFDVRICDRPDFLFYTNEGDTHRLYNCFKIYYTHEPIRANFRDCDFAFTSFYEDHPRHMRLPYYALLYRAEDLIRKPGAHAPALAGKEKFCSYMVSNHNRRLNRNRLEVFEKFSSYKRVDSGGRFMNNIGGPLPGGFEAKIAWMRNYKFHLAFENARLDGYTTEKLCQALLAGTLPIFWGNARVGEDFNPDSFIDASNYKDFDTLLEKIKELDRDEDQYLHYLSQPALPNNQPTQWFDRNRLLDQFERIFDMAGPTLTQRRRRSRLISFGRWVLVKRHHL